MSTTIKISVGIIAVVVGVVFFGMVSEVYADPGTCRIQDVVGSISGSSGSVRNVSDRVCTAGLASFKFYSFSDQELHDVTTFDVGPGKTHEFNVSVPECDYQIDLFAGNFPGSHHFSADHLIAAEVVTNRCPEPTPAPTPAPTPTPTPTPTITPSPTVTPSPTPIFTPLSCSPAMQLVGSGGFASLRANGGTGIYFWSAPGGDPSQGFYQDFTTRYFSSVDSINQVTVRSGGEVATCTVRVQASASPTPTPTPGAMSIQKTGRNITQGQATETTSIFVRGNDTVEFILRVRSLSSVTLTNVVVQDALPQGVNYIPNTTSVNGVLVQDGLTGGGINIGSLTPGQEAVVRFSALVAPGTTFPNGTLTAINLAFARADNVPSVSSQATLTRSSIGQVAGVQTGPGETLLLTLLLSGGLTYGYMLYTGTSLFNRRDALAKVRQYAGNRDRLNFMRFLR